METAEMNADVKIAVKAEGHRCVFGKKAYKPYEPV